MSGIEQTYLGTWQFDYVTESAARSLVAAAHDVGISHFDTAHVYAGGRAEHILGEELHNTDTVVTKIPATHKNEVDEDLAYPTAHMALCLQTSTERLRRPPAVILLHNWHKEWESVDSRVLSRLREVAKHMGILRIGISLPDRYDGYIEDSPHFHRIDCVEAPYNNKSPGITLARLAHFAATKEVLARSLFMHGKDISNISHKIHSVLASGCHPLLGATKPEQIYQWGI